MNDMNMEDLRKKLAELEAATAAASKGQPAPEPAPEKAPEPAEDDEPAFARPETPERVETPAESIPAAQDSGFLPDLLNTPGMSMDALAAATEAAESSGGFTDLFPTMTQTPGTTGGALERAAGVSDEDAHDLPEGRKPVTLVFLAYRFYALAWPTDGNSGPSEGKARPVYSCAIPSNRGDLARSLTRAARKFQFTPAAKKAELYDYETSGIGHLKAGIEVLAFDPVSERLIVYRSPAHYSSADETRKALLSNASTLSDGSKAMRPFIGVFSPQSDHNVTKRGQKVVFHYLGIRRMDIAEPEAREAWEKYRQFGQAAQNDASLQAKVNDWMQGADSPITQACETSIAKGAEL